MAHPAQQHTQLEKPKNGFEQTNMPPPLVQFQPVLLRHSKESNDCPSADHAIMPWPITQSWGSNPRPKTFVITMSRADEEDLLVLF